MSPRFPHSTFGSPALWLLCGLFIAGIAALGGCSGGTEGDGGDAAATDAGATDGGSRNGGATAAAPNTAKAVLEAMAKAYREAESYQDGGLVRVKYTINGGPFEDEHPLSVAYESPNRLRLHAYGGIICCDGKKLYASHEDVSGYVVTAEAPLKLTPDDVFSDAFMREKLTAEQYEPLQLMLLLDPDLVPRMLEQVGEENFRLLEDEQLDGDTYRRVELSHDGRSMVFWIAPESKVLRRVDYPTDELKQQLERDGGEVTDVSVTADFAGAELNGELDEVAFQFDPEGAEEVRRFIGPAPQLLGKKAGDFAFTLPDGAKLTPADLKGKVAVLDFWATWCTPCLQNMPNLAQVYEKYKGNDKVQIVAVSVDQPDVTQEQIAETIAALKVDVPLARASPKDVENIFGADALPIPNVLVLGPDGIVQDNEVGIDPGVDPVENLVGKIEDVLAGKNLYEERLAQFKQAMMELPTATELPPVSIAEKSAPQRVKLTKVWKSEDVALPGNIYLLPQPEGPLRALVHDGWQTLVEVGLDGKVVARHPLSLPEGAVATFTRTATDKEGKRYYVCSAIGQQQVHVLDAEFKLLFRYPEVDPEAPHPGIFDAALADLEGDGTLDLAVSYLDVAGVQRVSLEGARQWSSRSLRDVFSLTVTPPDEEGRRQLLCTSSLGKLAVLNPSGSRADDIETQRFVRLLAGADLAGDGNQQYVALGFTPQGTDVLVSVALDGSEAWSYPMPVAQQHPSLEQIRSGRLVGEANHWVVAGPDGSLHLIAADGTLLDRFNYGAIVSGFAVAEIDGKPALLIASEKNGLEAWTVESVPAAG